MNCSPNSSDHIPIAWKYLMLSGIDRKRHRLSRTSRACKYDGKILPANYDARLSISYSTTPNSPRNGRPIPATATCTTDHGWHSVIPHRMTSAGQRFRIIPSISGAFLCSCGQINRMSTSWQDNTMHTSRPADVTNGVGLPSTKMQSRTTVILAITAQ